MVHFVVQGRRWSDGLHQAVEAKEALPIQNETVTLASISYQNFFLQVNSMPIYTSRNSIRFISPTLLNAFSPHCLQFPKLCGMTGTAATEGTEFDSIYKLKVTIVPTNKPMIRKV